MRIAVMMFALLLSAPALAQQDSTAADTLAIYIPVDLDDALDQIDQMLSEESIDEIRALDDEDEFGGMAHFGLGIWMRNNWGLWGGSRLAEYFNGLGIWHPDDMSGIILDSYYRRLHGQPIKLDEQVAYYQAYWEEAREQQEEDDGNR